MATIVAVDPGGQSGVAIRTPEGYSVCVMHTAEELWQLLIDARPGQIVVENFATSSWISKYGLHTVRLVGGVQAIAQMLHLKLKIQQPQHRHAFQKEAAKLCKTIASQTTDHERDALAHLLAFEHDNR